MMSSDTEPVVYIAVPMKDEPTSVPSPPAIFVPSTTSSRERIPSNENPFKSLIRGALVLFLGFGIVTLLWNIISAPCHHSMLMRGGNMRHMGMHPSHPGMHDLMHSHKNGMGHHEHHNDSMNGMMMRSHEHGMGHHKHPGDHVLMHDMMMHPNNDGKRWKVDHSSTANQDGMDGWYAGNKSHDGWHASFVDEASEDGNDNIEEQTVGALSLEAVERVEIEKEDGMVPGLP